MSLDMSPMAPAASALVTPCAEEAELDRFRRRNMSEGMAESGELDGRFINLASQKNIKHKNIVHVFVYLFVLVTLYANPSS